MGILRRPEMPGSGWEFGFDACIDYRQGDVAAHSSSTARGVNVYFETLGPIRRRAKRSWLRGKGRAVWRDLQLPLQRAPRTSELREHPSPRPRRCRVSASTSGAGSTRLRRALAAGSRRGSWCIARPSTRASNAASTPQRAVHRSQHRQDARQGRRASRVGSDRPAFTPVSGVEEHPLVARGRREMSSRHDASSVGVSVGPMRSVRSRTWPRLPRIRHHRSCRSGAGGGDQRADSGAPNLRVDPVTRQDRGRPSAPGPA